MIRSMRNRFPELMFSCTMGFGADAWSRLFPEKGKPKELNTFEEIKGGEAHGSLYSGRHLVSYPCKTDGVVF